jgi:hypothetical protein
MKIAPFRIRRIALDSAQIQVQRLPVDCFESGNSQHRVVNSKVVGYSVTSTAPFNTDQEADLNAAVDNSPEQAEAGIRAIAQELHRIKTDATITEPPQLVIAVHGYNTAETGIRSWYHDIFRYIAHDDKQIAQKRNVVFIGYRWSSEQMLVKPHQLWKSLQALPNVPRAVLGAGLILLALYFGGIVAEVLRSLEVLPPFSLSTWLFAQVLGEMTLLDRAIQVAALLLLRLLMGGAIVATIAVAVLLLLRVSVYFRDVYRAINFAVPDLTELIRQIDLALVNLAVDDIQHTHRGLRDALRKAKEQHNQPGKRVELNFLGHSMGGLVITNTVRILSDVFDSRSITQIPTSEIGNTLRLGRLILASPDIPVLSVVSSRANGLASSLRRFDEAYLFSNEGDLALRLASTAANYISFPSTSHYHGHRLGSIALRDNIRFSKGILNLESLRQKYAPDKSLCEAVSEDDYDILKCLFITHNSGKGDGYQSLEKLFVDEHKATSPATLADLFTFFDCTDYKDYSLHLRGSAMNARSQVEKGLLTRAKGKPYLKLRDYAELLWDMARGHRDVHGGYFYGEYSRELIYRLAFLGFGGMLKAIAHEEVADVIDGPQHALDVFSQRCDDKGIQVYLSPLRYRVDVQGAPLATARKEMLQTVQAVQGKGIDLEAQAPEAASEQTVAA